MTNYIKFNKGNIDKLPNPDKRGARYYHESELWYKEVLKSKWNLSKFDEIKAKLSEIDSILDKNYWSELQP